MIGPCSNIADAFQRADDSRGADNRERDVGSSAGDGPSIRRNNADRAFGPSYRLRQRRPPPTNQCRVRGFPHRESRRNF